MMRKKMVIGDLRFCFNKKKEDDLVQKKRKKEKKDEFWVLGFCFNNGPI